MFGFPLQIVAVASSMDILGPNGMFCHFDGVRGRTLRPYFVTLPVVAIITVNIVLYWLTWCKIRKVESHSVLKGRSSVASKSHRAVKKMSLFVLVFFIQWIPAAVLSVWNSVTPHVPILLIQFATTFTNLGGKISR